MPSTRHLAGLAPALLAAAALAQAPSQTPAAAEAPETQTAAPESTPAALPSPNTTDVHTGIRIVRLSQTNGVVAMSRGFTADPSVPSSTPAPFETAFTNLPIVQGAELRTGEGVAEVEFEDNSTIRLAPDTLVRFQTLTRSPAGVTTSVMQVVHGMVYAAAVKGKGGNLFALGFGDRRAVLTPGTHLRLQIADTRIHLAVFDGSANVEGPSGNLAVEKKHGLLVDPANPTVATLTGKETEPSPFDSWDKQSASFHQGLSNVSAYAGTGGVGGLYGLNDMNYYGSFNNLGACGSLWQPYFASASWNPYSYGVFAYYPGAGYSFVSPYPWGWTPFHSGSWQQCGAAGWGWRPSGGFIGLGNTSVIPTRGRPPLIPPHAGQLGLVVVNTHPPTLSHSTAEGAFVFNRDSAGLGVPRESFGKLGGVSRLVVDHGTANIPLAEPGPVHGNLAPHASLAGALRPAPVGPVSVGPHPVSQSNTGGYSTLSPSTSTSTSTSRMGSAPAPSAAGAAHSGGAAGASHH